MQRVVVWLVLSVGGTVLGGTLGSLAGWASGTHCLREHPEFQAGQAVSEDVVPRGVHTLLAGFSGAVSGYFLGVTLAGALEGRGRPVDRDRYDMWVVPDDDDPQPTIVAVAALLCLDPKLARKLVTSGSPVRRGIGERDVRYLHARFSTWGVAVRTAPELGLSPASWPLAVPEQGPLSRPERWLVQGFTGLILGVLAGVIAF